MPAWFYIYVCFVAASAIIAIVWLIIGYRDGRGIFGSRD